MPRIIALDHTLPPAHSQVRNAIKNLEEKKPEKLFIELFEDQSHDPHIVRGFLPIVKRAAELGIKVVYLDRTHSARFDSHLEAKIQKESIRKNLLASRHLDYDLRERNWANIIKRQSTDHDLIIVHPNHAQALSDRIRSKHGINWLSIPVKLVAKEGGVVIERHSKYSKFAFNALRKIGKIRRRIKAKIQ